MRQVEHEPRLRHALHPRANLRDELTDPEQPEITVAEGAETHRRRPGRAPFALLGGIGSSEHRPDSTRASPGNFTIRRSAGPAEAAVETAPGASVRGHIGELCRKYRKCVVVKHLNQWTFLGAWLWHRCCNVNVATDLRLTQDRSDRGTSCIGGGQRNVSRLRTSAASPSSS